MSVTTPTRAEDWLACFEAVGGGYAASPELRFFWAVQGRSDAEQAEARRLHTLLDENIYLWADVTAAIEARSAREALS
ncbi:hypothetical protein [Sphingobium phenoxybenzoativorans]|uniref:hypothetical protein n=1 Tax=Sphingobium phenoxybenzoativorans TaxID=1592790 RepID=UPI0008727740|nr:hypothetical protein [Sphingobium phenoxybenzoativorans]